VKGQAASGSNREGESTEAGRRKPNRTSCRNSSGCSPTSWTSSRSAGRRLRWISPRDHSHIASISLCGRGQLLRPLLEILW